MPLLRLRLSPARAFIAAASLIGLIACPGGSISDEELLVRLRALGYVESETTRPTGFFSTGLRDGRIWLIDPAGKPFFSLGVSGIRAQNAAPLHGSVYYNPVESRYDGDETRWIEASLDRLRRWKFNTIGSWSHQALRSSGMPYAKVLGLAPAGPTESKLDRIFSPGFADTVRVNALQARQFRDDPQLVGYFLDNELPWWGETGWRDDGRPTLLEKYARSGLHDENKSELIAFFRERYDEPSDFNAVWNMNLDAFDELAGAIRLVARTRAQKRDEWAWAGRVAERYFSVTASAVREVDPNHLILGARFAGRQIWEVVDACGRAVDVVSINHYSSSGDVDAALLDNIFSLTLKPLLISEYSFRATENQSGNPNRRGPEVTVSTQSERVEYTTRYLSQALELPYVVGLHWFSWADQSPQGRFDLEDSNLGLVDVHDGEYRRLVRALTHLNARAEDAHRRGAAPYPDGFVSREEPRIRESVAATTLPSKTEASAFVDFSRPVRSNTWGHAGYGGHASVEQVGYELRVRYDTGAGWGSGVSILPERGAPSDLTGYDTLYLDLEAPEGASFFVYLTESGSGPPQRRNYEGLDGADGESYSLPMQTGTGSWTTYRLRLEELDYRSEWGSQHGNGILDLQSLGSIDIHVAGGQGNGQLSVRRIELAREPD